MRHWALVTRQVSQSSLNQQAVAGLLSRASHVLLKGGSAVFLRFAAKFVTNCASVRRPCLSVHRVVTAAFYRPTARVKSVIATFENI